MIRIRQTEDLEVIKALNAEIFPRTGAIDEEDLDESTWWVAEFQSMPHAYWEPIGFGGVRLYPEHAFLTRAGVLKAFRGAGVQQRLIRARVAFAKRAGVSVVRTYTWAGNTASMRSLCKVGFLPYTWERTTAAGGQPCTFIHLERKLKNAA